MSTARAIQFPGGPVDPTGWPAAHPNGITPTGIAGDTLRAPPPTHPLDEVVHGIVLLASRHAAASAVFYDLDAEGDELRRASEFLFDLAEWRISLRNRVRWAIEDGR